MLRSFLPLLLVLLAAGCTARDMAQGFKGWCSTAPNCTDHERFDPKK